VTRSDGRPVEPEDARAFEEAVDDDLNQAVVVEDLVGGVWLGT
jgi:hypothetical protein